MKKLFYSSLFLIFYFFTFQATAQDGATVSFEKFISLRGVGSPSISPDGQHVAFTVGSTDWKENQFDNEIWLSKNGETPFQLTRTTKGGSGQIRWSPDSKWIAFTADRGNKSQIYVIRISGGEAQAVTNEEEGIGSFEWTPEGKKFVFTMNEKESKAQKSQKERYGAWAEEDTEYQLSHLWAVDFKPDLPLNELPCNDSKKDSTKKQDCVSLPKAERLTEGKFTVGNFGISPDGTKIVFSQQPNPLINTFFKSDISILDFNTKKISTLIKNPSIDNFVVWSPDSKAILYSSNENDTTTNYYTNNKVFKLDLSSNQSERIGAEVDENIGSFSWTPNGIFFVANQKTKRYIYQYDLKTKKSKIWSGKNEYVTSLSFTKDGSKIAFSAQTPTTLGEIYTSPTTVFQPTALTNMSQQIADWNVGTAEVISWKSQDGAEIEGVLHKPKNYDPKKKYPLLVVIHGGPTGIDVPSPVAGYVYPILQWVEKGALVLRPNYRGSAGYGEKFRALNVQNLGVGDMWDVMSGIDFLNNLGIIDTNKMGSMGWSQGGYISAFLTTNTNRFKAISVGAGISNWVTYYVNTDIHPFTKQYLKNNPWQDMNIYLKTSPMTNIKNASTPTLIQHGEFDRRVPIPNAYELYQGLQDMNVPTKLVVYKGFGHGITKPKERLAAIWHNWQWFNKYLWGENVEIPMEK
jgi:dipeptidyl aminopeptidase/acylaminoacyl peptidase